jgi:hypothetical protein
MKTWRFLCLCMTSVHRVLSLCTQPAFKVIWQLCNGWELFSRLFWSSWWIGILCCWVTMNMWLKESVHWRRFVNVADGSSESRNLAHCYMVSTRSSAEEMTRNVVGTWLVSLPSAQYCAHDTLSPEFFFTKKTPLFPLPPPPPPTSLLCVSGRLLVVLEFGS